MGILKYYILLFFISHFRANVDVQRRVQNMQKKYLVLQVTMRIATICTVGRARTTSLPGDGN
jgi:hypothetical protein